MKNLKISAVLINLFLSVLFAGAFTIATGIQMFPIATVVLFAASFIPGPYGVLSATIRTEAWVRDIKENLFDDNPHVTKGINHSSFVSDSIVNVPQAGANPNVEKNRTSLPATVQQRTDTNLTYNIDEYTTDPFLIPNADVNTLSYNKRQSILRQHIDTINDDIGDQAGFVYATDTTARQVKTTGAASGDALAPGATGTRLALVKEDIRKVAQIFDADKVPKAGRMIVLDSDMYWQLFDDDTMTNRDHIGKAGLPEGVVNRLFGIDIMVRSKIVVYDVANDKKAPGASPVVTDHLGCVAFHRNSVSWALNGIKVLARDESQNPEWYGTILSAIVRYAAAVLRTDEKGIVSIVQAA